MRLRFDGRARAILRRIPVVNVYSVAEIALLALLAVQGARLVWAVVTPVSPLGEWRPAEPGLAGDAGAVLRGFDPFFRITGRQQPAAVTSLNVKLFGIRIDEAMGRGSAIVAGADGIQKSVSVGEEIAPGVVLKSVAFDHITIERGGAAEDLFLDQSGAPAPVQPASEGATRPGGTPAAAPAPSAPAQSSQEMTMQQLRSDVGVVPRIDGGRISGLTVRPAGSGQAFRAAGLRSGDVVTALGGRPVSGPDDLARVGRDLAAGGVLAMTVERGGRTLPLSVRVAPR